VTKVVGYSSEEDFRRAANAIRYIERGGIDHPYYRRQTPVDTFEILRGKLDSSSSSGASTTVPMGSFGTVSRYNPNDDTDTGINDRVKFVIGPGTPGKWYYYTTMGDHYEAIGGQC